MRTGRWGLLQEVLRNLGVVLFPTTTAGLGTTQQLPKQQGKASWGENKSGAKIRFLPHVDLDNPSVKRCYDLTLSCTGSISLHQVSEGLPGVKLKPFIFQISKAIGRLVKHSDGLHGPLSKHQVDQPIVLAILDRLHLIGCPKFWKSPPPFR